MTAHKTTTHDGVRWGKAYSSTWCTQCYWVHTTPNKQEAAQAAKQHEKENRALPSPPLRVYKVEHFAWIANCRRCLFIGAYNSHPLAIEAALFHHDDCLYKTTEQTCS